MAAAATLLFFDARLSQHLTILLLVLRAEVRLDSSVQTDKNVVAFQQEGLTISL